MLGATPLVVVTAAKDAQDGWLPLQDDLASLSSNSEHRALADATHASLTDEQAAASASSEAILRIVEEIRRLAPPAE